MQGEKIVGHEFTIVGNFDFLVPFNPSITVDSVTFENVAWGTRPKTLKFVHVDAKVALSPMPSGNIEIEHLILEN